MGTLTGTAIIDKVELTLSDTSNVRWTAAELLGWLNSAQRAIAILKPNVCTTTTSIALVAGARQSIGATYHQLLEVTRNMGAAGAVPGRAIRPLNRSDLDNADPEWSIAANADATVKGFLYDDKDPRVFWVYPPQPTGTTAQVEAILAGPPTDLATAASTIALADVYETPLMDYMLYRAFAKDTASVGNLARSDAFYKQFVQGLGLHAQVERAAAPDAPGASAASGGRQPAP
ncbi:MAG: hypothetical protein P1P84_02665 [Deferrisomatales bacterium]|nr:hypothetical protein [Deferrisomatales bacterium]